jgi:hypothetical protein
MNQAPSFYNLYCVNIHCDKSIHLHGVQTRAIFDIENLTATHICTGCRQPLFSPMDIEIGQMITEAGMSIPHKSYYNTDK